MGIDSRPFGRSLNVQPKPNLFLSIVFPSPPAVIPPLFISEERIQADELPKLQKYSLESIHRLPKVHVFT
jgi:hypothetical protein